MMLKQYTAALSVRAEYSGSPNIRNGGPVDLYRFDQIIEIFFVQKVRRRHKITAVFGYRTLIDERDIIFG